MSAPSAELSQELRPYAAILEHAELELGHAGRGEIDRLTECSALWEQLVAALPRTAPAAAAPMLERAALMHERTRVELIRLREAVLAEHTGAARARRAAAGYGGDGGRAPLLDRSA